MNHRKFKAAIFIDLSIYAWLFILTFSFATMLPFITYLGTRALYFALLAYNSKDKIRTGYTFQGICNAVMILIMLTW